jgi:hypothetical protein
MEALVLALGLRMIGAAMTNPDTEPDQPQAQAGGGQIAVAPRRAVVHQYGGRQPIAAKHPGQRLLHGGPGLVGAGLKQHGEARMVIEHGQWMTAAAVEQGKVALEVHLPQGVGRDMFEALPGALAGGGGAIQQVGAAQDGGDGTRRQARTTFVSQQPRQPCVRPTNCATRAAVR